MNFIKKGAYILFCLLYIVTNFSFGQAKSRIEGKLVENHLPIEFATISLAKLPDSTKIVHLATSDSLGYFLFENIDFAKYKIKISLIGYNTLVKNIEITDKKHVLDFGNIELMADNSQLSEVVVTAQKKLIQKTNEGFIINAAANLTQAGGTVTDILKNTPTVAVDADGAITLRGKTPLILINGRNSNLTNTDQITASSIESIEIITNASAKYDANAESGIINIILKKNKADGTNGALAAGIGTGSRFRINNSLIINHKTGKWNIGLGYDNRFAGRTRSIIGSRTNYNLPETYLLNQDRYDERFERLQNLKLNVDYQINNMNSLAFEGIGNLQGQDNDETLMSIFKKQNLSFNNGNDRHSLELRRSKVAEFALNFNRKFANDKKALSASITSSIENGKENTEIDTQLLTEAMASGGNPIWQRTHNYEKGVISNAKIDYSLPISTNNLLDFGYKGIFRNIKTDFETSNKIGEVFEINSIVSNVFNFNEQVHALYALLHSNKKSNWNYDLGLRAELVNNMGETQNKSTHFTNDYLKIFPTANLIYILKPESFWKLSYGKRINRPGLGQLNPFIDITDALNPHSGNPDLKPEIIHAMELSYNKELNNLSFSSNFFYRYSKNTIRSFFQEIGNGVVLNKPMNIGVANSYGLENVFIGKLNKTYDFNISATLFELKLNASNLSSDAIQSSFNWFGKFINNFVINKNAKLQVVGNYTSAATTPQGRLIRVYFADLGFQQKFGKGNARLGITLVDIFNSLKSGSKNYTTEFYSKRTSKADTRAIMLTFAFSFKAQVKDKMLENKFSREW